jgi:hypothetical protein
MQLGILSRIRLNRAGSGFYGLDDREVTARCEQRTDTGAWVVATETLRPAIRREQERLKEKEDAREAATAAYKDSVHRQVQRLLDEADPRWSQIAYDWNAQLSFPAWKQFTEGTVALAAEYGVRPHLDVGVPWTWVLEAIRQRIKVLEKAYADRLRAEGPTPELGRLLEEMAAKEDALQAAEEELKEKERALRDRYETKAGPLQQEIAALRDQILAETPARLFPASPYFRNPKAGQILAFMSPRP